MKDIRFDGGLDFVINKIGFVNVLRDENFVFEYKTGKKFFSFIYVESGELEYYFKNVKKRFKIAKGNMLFIPKQFPYKTKYLKNKTQIKIILFDFTGDNLPFQMNNPFEKSSFEISDIFSVFTTQNSNNIFLLYSKVYELINLLKNEERQYLRKHNKILPAIEEITKEYYKNNKVKYYADLCNMSESNFRKLFHEYTGKSFISYRNSLRLYQVKKMISSGEFTVSEAAYLSGFNNMSFFYSLYNKFNERKDG